MTISEFIAAYRAILDEAIREQTALLTTDLAVKYEDYVREWAKLRGFIEARQKFDETVKKAYE